MPPGTDGDDEELFEIDVEIDGPPPLPGASAPELVAEGGDTEPNRGGAPAAPAEEPPPAPPDILEISDAVELQPPIVEAATDDLSAALALYEAEAAAAEGGRKGALLLEVARLEEVRAGEDRSPAALASARAAFATDPASVPAVWLLRRLLVRAGGWEELAAIYEQATQAPSSAADPRLRAELLIARGRLLEDRLARLNDAVASYREALAAVPDHPGALLSLLLAGARGKDPALSAEALGGLARRAETATARAALVIEEALAWRRAEPRDGADRALAVLEDELGRNDTGSPVAALLAELEGLSRADVPAPAAARALEDLAKRLAEVDAGLAVALLRERAHLLRRELLAPEAALETLDQAARLDPTHALVASERLELALALDRRDAAAEIARAFLLAAERDDEAVDFALASAEAIFDPARPEAAVEILQTPRVQACRPARADLRALELALAVVRRDPRALADAFALGADAETHADATSKVTALIAAGAVRAGPLGQTDVAGDLYQRALDSSAPPAQVRPALQALVSLRAAAGRIEEATAILETALAVPSSSGEGTGEADAAFEVWARESLVAFYADELGAPGRALPHQQRLVAMQPQERARRVRLCDLDLESGPDGLRPSERADNLMALAAGAGDRAVEIALRVMAGRALGDSPEPRQVAEGLALLGEVAAVDPSGLAAARLERAAASPAARAAIVAAELDAAAENGPAERTRGLRFRLAHHRAAAGAFAEAMAALTPLRSEGDPLARAWSYALARRAGDAFLEVAVLSEETRAPDGTLGDEAGVLLAHGEALAEAGDPQAAADSLRRAIARAPDGETAADAALALYRLATVAATSPGGSGTALPEALEALAAAVGDDPPLAAAVAREAALSALAVGSAVAAGGVNRTTAPANLGDASAAHAELTLLRFMTGVRAGDAKTVAESLTEIARGLASADGAVPGEAVPLLARAAARARLGGAETAEAVAVAVWETAHPPALAPALADLPVAGAAPWPSARPDPRRSRARRVGGALGVALHLEAALDAERQGELGAALAAYGSVIALDPDRLEAWTGVRRVARAGGDLLGEARALARLGALVRDPRRAAALLAEAGSAYESAGRDDDAIAVLCRAVELCPDDAGAYARVHALLGRDLAAPGRAATLDGLLSYRLAAGRLTAGERISLLFERAEHRLTLLADRRAAFQDLKQILKIRPNHLASLHKLAQGALADQDPGAAAPWLERYLAAAGADDPERKAAAKLDLAACYEARGETGRAIETLRLAALASPDDPTPLQRMAEIQLRRRDARGAVEALQGAAARLGDPRAQAALALKIGAIERDVARDPSGAAAAFRQAADLDPLGAGAATLVSLYDAASDARGALEIVEREIADLRRALAASPLDARRLERLGQWLAEARRRGGADADAEAVVENVRGLAGGRASPLRTPATVVPKTGRAFLTEIADRAAGGFVAEVWPHLREAAAALFPPPARPRPAPLGPELAPRVAWIQAAASAIGIARLGLFVAREPGAPPAEPIDDAEPSLILAPDAPAWAVLRFHVGRALGLIAQNAVVLERVSAAELAPLFACAALLAGAQVPVGLPIPAESLLRDVTRAVGRKDRKSLALQASRFGFEAFDLEAWRTATLRAADRFGLFVSGDPAAAAAAVAGGAQAVPGSPAAVDLLGFALGDRYSALRRAVEGGER